MDSIKNTEIFPQTIITTHGINAGISKINDPIILVIRHKSHPSHPKKRMDIESFLNDFICFVLGVINVYIFNIKCQV